MESIGGGVVLMTDLYSLGEAIGCGDVKWAIFVVVGYGRFGVVCMMGSIGGGVI